MEHIYVASCDDDGGLFHYLLQENGQLIFCGKYPLAKPVYCATERNKLYALLREPFWCQSGVVCFTIKKDGSLSSDSKIVSTHGAIAAQILAYNGCVYVANYISGTTIRLPDKMVVHHGKGPDPLRQDAPHPHCVVSTPDGEHICVADLGTDTIYVFDIELNLVSKTKLPEGVGPRHMVFSLDGRYTYCCNELASSVSVLEYSGGTLKYLFSYPTLPYKWEGKNAAAAIRIDETGPYLLVSNRGHDSICVFVISDDKLVQTNFIPSGGHSPRDFYLVNNFLLVANEASNNIVSYSFKDGQATATEYITHITKPWCIISVDLGATSVNPYSINNE